MSTPKNKLSADFDRRGKRASVVQRFITAEQQPTETAPNPEQSIEPEQIAEAEPDISQIAETFGNIENIENPAIPSEVNTVKEPNETEELKSKIEFLTSQLDKIKEIENKINSIETAQNKLKNDANTDEQAEKIKQPEIIAEQPPKYYLRNVMEEAVVEEVTAALKHMSGICKCEKCFYDICAIALNSISPNYATSGQGELLGKANTLLNAAIRNKMSGEVFKAAEKVKKQPMHG